MTTTDTDMSKLAAEMMDKVHTLIPGDSPQAHADRARCAVAIRNGFDVYELLVQMGYVN